MRYSLSTKRLSKLIQNFPRIAWPRVKSLLLAGFWPRGALGLLGLSAFFCLSGCNHLFYYPLREIKATPTDYALRYESFMVPSVPPVDLAVWWIKPSNPPEQRRLLVHWHGNAENMSTHFLYVAWLAKRGYDVLTFDYRGYGLSTPLPPTQEGLLEDSCALLRWIGEHPELGRMPLFALGQSLGGAIAIPALAQCAPQNLKGIVIDSSFSSYRRVARLRLEANWLTWPLQVPLSYLISDRVSPLEAIPGLHAPLLFFHSPADPVVPYAEGRALFEAARSAKRFVDVNEAGHTLAFALEKEEYRAILLQFLEQNSEGAKSQE